MIIDPPPQPSPDHQLADHRRASTSLDAPPPYELGGTVGPSLIQDEKRRHIDAHPVAPILEPGVYTDPPAAFSRIASVSVATLTPFAPMTIPVEGSGKALDKGFVLTLPGSSEPVHPFEQRDISAADWTRFMQDLKDGTALSKTQQRKALLIPLFLGLGPAACWIKQAAKGKARKQKLAYAINLINVWNQHFFAPRRVEVILMRGSYALTKYSSESVNNQSSTSLSDISSGSEGKVDETVVKENSNSKAMKLVVVSL